MFAPKLAYAFYWLLKFIKCLISQVAKGKFIQNFESRKWIDIEFDIGNWRHVYIEIWILDILDHEFISYFLDIEFLMWFNSILFIFI